MELKCKVSLKDLALSARVIEGLAREAVQNAILYAVSPIKKRVDNLVDDALENSDEWKSLLGGKLRQEFGLANPSDFLAKIKQSIVQAIYVYPVNTPGSLGGIRVDILPLEVEKTLASAMAYNSKGGKVDWLNWLLFSGTARVVADARFQMYTKQVSGSRAGFSLMIKNGNLGYSVSNEFAGVEGANWFDRIIEPLGPIVLDAMLDEVQKQL